MLMIVLLGIHIEVAERGVLGDQRKTGGKETDRNGMGDGEWNTLGGSGKAKPVGLLLLMRKDERGVIMMSL
jgi:hypothetical protein